jgi:hypothetical protein
MAPGRIDDQRSLEYFRSHVVQPHLFEAQVLPVPDASYLVRRSQRPYNLVAAGAG